MDANDVKRVLIADDEFAILLAFRKVLQAPEVEVDTASSADEALELVGNKLYAAVIADLRMSGAEAMEGYDVIRETRSRHPDAKIVVITAYGDESIKDTVFSLGADMYLEKPVSPNRVKQILSSMGVYDHRP